jgi:hypothetical protein
LASFFDLVKPRMHLETALRSQLYFLAALAQSVNPPLRIAATAASIRSDLVDLGAIVLWWQIRDSRVLERDFGYVICEASHLLSPTARSGDPNRRLRSTYSTLLTCHRFSEHNHNRSNSIATYPFNSCTQPGRNDNALSALPILLSGIQAQLYLRARQELRFHTARKHH